MLTFANLQALILQLVRIGIGGVGVYLLVKGQQATGWALIGASGITAAIDVAKVNNQVTQAAALATAQASSTTQITVQKPADPANANQGAG